MAYLNRLSAGSQPRQENPAWWEGPNGTYPAGGQEPTAGTQTVDSRKTIAIDPGIVNA